MIKEMIWEVHIVRNKKPPFEITEAALSDVMEISELVGKISSTQNLSTSPILRRQNRIRTIYSSLAIEQNTLSLEQVTAVLSGKRVLAPPKDIAEVKNAYEIYDHLAELNPYYFSPEPSQDPYQPLQLRTVTEWKPFSKPLPTGSKAS